MKKKLPLNEAAIICQEKLYDGYFTGHIFGYQEAFKEGAKWALDVWHKADDYPDNRHPYPVINPDTMEMAFAYYDRNLRRWEFDREYNPGDNMLWMDIEAILPTNTK